MLTITFRRCLALFLALAAMSACGGPVQRVDLQNPDGKPQQVARAPEVLVVSLTGKLGTVEIARCHRALREAAVGSGDRAIKYVVFRMVDAGSIGESRGDLQSLYDRVQSMPSGGPRTVAVLSGRVTQGAAALALMVDSVYCLPGAQWGEITKPEKEVDEVLAVDPEAAQGRIFDAARSAVEMRLARRDEKLRPEAEQLALAMADPRVQLVSAIVREGGVERPRVLTADELTRLQQSGAAVFQEQPLPRPLMVTAQQAEAFGLSSGTLPGFDAISDWLQFDPDLVGELTENWAERMVAWLELLSPFLLIAGFVMLLIEVKTPGTGLPGLLGCVFLGLSMFYSYLVGLAEVTEIVVFFLGIAAIAVEIFLLPGTVVFGVVGFLCLMLSLVLSWQSFVLPSTQVEEQILLTNLGNLVLLFVLVGVLGWTVWRVLPHVPVFNRMLLPPPGPGLEPDSNSRPSDLGLANDKLVALVGRTGRAATVLRPTGAMELEDDRVDVVTEGEYLPAGTAVRVLYVQGNRVVVARAEEGTAGARAGENGSVGVVLLLLVVGLALILAEVFFVTFGVVGFLAAASLLAALFLSFDESIAFGITMSIVEAFAAPLVMWAAFKLLPNTPFGRRLILAGPPTEGSGGAADVQLEQYLGKTGVTLSSLRPAGFARIQDHKVDVVTRGEMLPKDCPVVVLDVSGNRVVVARVRSETDQSTPATAPTAPPSSP